MMMRIFAAFAVLTVSLARLRPATAQAQCLLSGGAVVQLSGTPHLFIVDDRGVLHWGGDTRALAGRSIDWSNRCSVGLAALQAMPRGDPWLSSGLPKIGEPIYLSKWEDTEVAPTLLHIQSIDDVELFGIDESNYGTFIMDRAAWEQRFGLSVNTLQIGPLASAASFAWPAADQAAYSQLLINLKNVLSAALFRASQAGMDAGALLPALADCERAGLEEFDRGRNAGAALGVTQECLSRLNLGGPGPVVPHPPSNVRVSALSPTLIRITWDDNPNEGGYRIYGGEYLVPSSMFVAATPPNITSHDIPGRSPNSTYCYSVSAFNGAGESAAAGPVCAVTPSAMGGLSAPTNVVVSQISTGSGIGGLRIDWFDTSTTETGFQVLRGDQLVATVGANVTSYADLSWNPALPSCYRVAAINDFGQATSDQACLTGGGDNRPPTAPTNLRASVPAGGGIQLHWSDTSTNEAGFQILRDGHLIATVGVNVVTYIDPSWNPAAPSCYRIGSFNGFGSAISEQVCPATISTPPSPPTNLALMPIPGTGAIRLDWSDTSANEDGFRILRNNLAIAVVGSNATTYTDANPGPILNCYLVTAFNSAGESPSHQVCQTP
jgi:hypothetical protein